jgi:hypothetical protein
MDIHGFMNDLRWLAVIGLVIAFLPSVSFKTHSPLWRALGWLGFEVNQGPRVQWPGAKARMVLWALMDVGLGAGLFYVIYR